MNHTFPSFFGLRTSFSDRRRLMHKFSANLKVSWSPPFCLRHGISRFRSIHIQSYEHNAIDGIMLLSTYKKLLTGCLTELKRSDSLLKVYKLIGSDKLVRTYKLLKVFGYRDL